MALLLQRAQHPIPATRWSYPALMARWSGFVSAVAATMMAKRYAATVATVSRQAQAHAGTAGHILIHRTPAHRKIERNSYLITRSRP